MTIQNLKPTSALNNNKNQLQQNSRHNNNNDNNHRQTNQRYNGDDRSSSPSSDSSSTSSSTSFIHEPTVISSASSDTHVTSASHESSLHNDHDQNIANSRRNIKYQHKNSEDPMVTALSDENLAESPLTSSLDSMDGGARGASSGAGGDNNNDNSEPGDVDSPVDRVALESPIIESPIRAGHPHRPALSVPGPSSLLSNDNPNQNNNINNNNNNNNNDNNNVFADQYKSRLQAMHDLFERRFLNNPYQLPTSSNQHELSPIGIGLDSMGAAGPQMGLAPFQMGPFSVPNHHLNHHHDPNSPLVSGLAAAVMKPQMSNADNIDGPNIPFGLGPIPHLLAGFNNNANTNNNNDNNNQAFDGPQRGDQSAHSNYHTAAAALPSTESETQASNPGQKSWPKIFRFTDGRINLSDFEKQKKIRLSNKNQHNGENNIESAPIMFDGRQLKRKSFLILHGGIFS